MRRTVHVYPRGSHRRAMTLLELVVSAGVMSILIGGMASAVFVSTRLMHGDAGSAPAASRAAGAQSRIVDDLRYALSLPERRSDSITMVVPDRDGDGIPETIRYAWSGVAGDPLTYDYNETGAPAVLLENVNKLNFDYMLTTIPGASPAVGETDEGVLIMHDNGDTPKLTEFTVTALNWCAQCFLPEFPSGVVSWKITRVKFVAKRAGGAEGLNRIQIRPAGLTGQPGLSILEETYLTEAALSDDYLWVEQEFASLTTLDPAAGVCLVIVGTNPASSTIRYESRGSPMTPHTHFVTTSLGGVVWSPLGDQDDMVFQIYGTITTAN